MFGDLKRLGKETLVYGLSTVVGRALNFLLLPLYTHFLVPADYGLVATVYAYLAFFNILYQYGMDQAYLRFGATLELGDRPSNFSTPVWTLLFSSLLFSGALGFWSVPVARVADIPVPFSYLVVYCGAILALDALCTVPFAELRLAHRAWYYVGVKTVNIALNVVLNVLFLWKLRRGVEGVFLASLLTSAATFALLLPVFFKWLRPLFTPRIFEEMIRFGVPYIPAGLASMAVQVIDRPILQHMTNDAVVGVYQANYRLGIFMMMVVNMFDAAWRPFFLERAGKPDAKPLFGRVLTYYLVGACAITLAVSFFIADVVRLPVLGHPLIGRAYWAGLDIVPIILAGYLFNGVYLNFMVQVTIPKRTDLLIWATLAGAVVNIGSMVLMIPHWGMLGAAWATLLAYVAMAAALFALGQPLYPIPYEYERLAKVSLAFLLCGGAVWFGARQGIAGTPWLVLRAGALAAFPAMLFMSGFFDPGELEQAARLFKASAKT